MSKMGTYDHIEDSVEMRLSMDDLARELERLNYGTHRLLSALVRVRRSDPETEGCPPCRMLTDAIALALDEGGF